VKIGKIDKVELSGLIVLFIGVILLGFTFFSAFSFLAGSLNILATNDILQVFGESLAPLIEAIIRILYLGIMGWIGSVVTIRGVQLLKKEKTETPPKQEAKPQTKETEKTKTPESPKQVERSEETTEPSPPMPTLEP